VIAILHDINLPLLYADRIIFLKQGNMVPETSIASDVSPQIIKVVFDVDAKVMDIGEGRRVVIF